MTTPHAQRDTTKRDAKAIRELEQLATELREKLALYEAALSGLSVGIDDDARKLESFGLDARMNEAENDIAVVAVATAKDISGEMSSLEKNLAGDDEAEASLIEEDEADPETEGKRLADAGEKE